MMSLLEGRYSFYGWDSGDDIDPPEPGKQWLTITEDGEEYAIIVLRTDVDGLRGDADAIFRREGELEERGRKIVAALNLSDLVLETLGKE